jgi:hypothetical protein
VVLLAGALFDLRSLSRAALAKSEGVRSGEMNFEFRNAHFELMMNQEMIA